MERRPRRRYTREFKLEAVRLAAVDGRSQIARQLGIRVNQLRQWKQEFERARTPGPTRPRRQQLRREIARLRIENEIQKGAAIYFARESL